VVSLDTGDGAGDSALGLLSDRNLLDGMGCCAGERRESSKRYRETQPNSNCLKRESCSSEIVSTPSPVGAYVEGCLI
jgi:hypothetical protein